MRMLPANRSGGPPAPEDSSITWTLSTIQTRKVRGE